MKPVLATTRKAANKRERLSDRQRDKQGRKIVRNKRKKKEREKKERKERQSWGMEGKSSLHAENPLCTLIRTPRVKISPYCCIQSLHFFIFLLLESLSCLFAHIRQGVFPTHRTIWSFLRLLSFLAGLIWILVYLFFLDLAFL